MDDDAPASTFQHDSRRMDLLTGFAAMRLAVPFTIAFCWRPDPPLDGMQTHEAEASAPLSIRLA
jgi:hypothetical protein